MQQEVLKKAVASGNPVAIQQAQEAVQNKTIEYQNKTVEVQEVQQEEFEEEVKEKEVAVKVGLSSYLLVVLSSFHILYCLGNSFLFDTYVQEAEVEVKKLIKKKAPPEEIKKAQEVVQAAKVCALVCALSRFLVSLPHSPPHDA